jgi:hypothetical protein
MSVSSIDIVVWIVCAAAVVVSPTGLHLDGIGHPMVASTHTTITSHTSHTIPIATIVLCSATAAIFMLHPFVRPYVVKVLLATFVRWYFNLDQTKGTYILIPTLIRIISQCCICGAVSTLTSGSFVPPSPPPSSSSQPVYTSTPWSTITSPSHTSHTVSVATIVLCSASTTAALFMLHPWPSVVKVVCVWR